jgi:flagellar M-ring protein FliF
MAIAPRQGLFALFQGFNQLPNSQKLGMMLGLAAVIALVSGLWMWSQTPDYRVLYSNLSDRDGGTIIASLQTMNVPYKMAEGGGAILVPANQVYDVRLRLASQGLPRGGTVGFELMETQKLGTSQFLEQVNYQRALEGELARSIQSLSAVQGARVHLAIPRPSVFVREQQKPSASILLNLYPGRVLDASQVNGIVHMVSSSVPELAVKNVTVVDQAGNLLSQTADAIAQTGLDPSQLDYLRQVEQGYVKRIENILAPLAGPDNVRAQVTADLDFSQTEQTAETFKPNPTPAEAAIRSQQSAETVGGGGQAAGGVPGALSNQPPGAATAPLVAPGRPPATAAAATSTPANSHKESTVNYEVDKSISHVRQPVGAIKRLSVGVVLNYRKTTDKAGKVSYAPLSQVEMTQISNLVKEAMGFSQTRGDTLNVVNAAFSLADKAEAAPALPVWKDPSTIALSKEVVKNLLIAGVLFYLVFGVLRPLFRDLVRLRERAAPSPEALMEAAAGAGRQGVASYEENLKSAKELAKSEPKIVASVVKEWVEHGE